jgi:porphobilinogen synthase|tara:strand:- start:659 stop:1645 length:987 start_codon:yes stop_codon:yes gene_type:complete
MQRRPRRNRKTAISRAFIKETHLSVSNLVQPFFLVDGLGIKEEVKSMPGNFRMSIDVAAKEMEYCIKLGIKSFILFPAVNEELKDRIATYGSAPENFYLKAFQTFKSKFGDSVNLITDVALDPYSSDGHDGLVEGGEILNDETLPILGELALAQAKAGADIIGPSDMMDGRVEYIRNVLDENGFQNVSIMSYTAKYASAFYGPFRDALDSAPKKGDKKTYQMDPANKREALVEAELDFNEGADYMMVKPALPYLDIIHVLKENYDIPIVAYNVSGECSMLTAACQNGWLNFEKAMPEMLLSIKRAGADVIITYFAKAYAELARDGKIN